MIKLWQNVSDKSEKDFHIKSRLNYIKKRINDFFLDDDDGIDFSDKIIKRVQFMTEHILTTKYNIR